MQNHETAVITHGGISRLFKLCQCAKCNVVAQCTFNFDFYTLEEDSNGPLYCENCFMQTIQTQPREEVNICDETTESSTAD